MVRTGVVDAGVVHSGVLHKRHQRFLMMARVFSAVIPRPGREISRGTVLVQIPRSSRGMTRMGQGDDEHGAKG